MLSSMLNSNTFVSLKILEALMEKNLTEEQKAKIIAEGFAELESRYPDLKYHATKQDISETELKLIKEIKELDIKASEEREKIRLEMKELDIKAGEERDNIRLEMKELDKKASQERDNIRVEIKELDKKASEEREKIRREIKELDIKLTKEITEVRVDLTKEMAQVRVDLTKEIENSKNTTLKWTFIFWTTQMIALGGILYRLTLT